MAGCLDGMCTHTCNGNYVRCGAAGCCGAATMGNALAIAAGGQTSCAVTQLGAALCWGDGAYGQLGNGATNTFSPTAVPVGHLVNVASLSVGGHHVCAVMVDGGAACWGDDQQGQLGDASRTPNPQPVTPAGLTSGVVAIAAGALHTCALTSAGGVLCWGDDEQGQLGTGPLQTQNLVPVAVSGLASGVAAIAAGDAFTCAATTTGGVKCWGDGSHGQLGGPLSSNAPVDVTLPAPVTALALGAQHACALTPDGRVLCWGDNEHDQLGTGSSSSSQASAVQVHGLSNVAAIAAGGNETCALDQAGAVRCWGADPVGDVGLGPSAPAIVPSLDSGVVSIGAVGDHACAVTSGGAPKCWGTNGAGELGDGTTIDSWVPVDVKGL
jgi:alpha-tubulin suppressor-like RCC1 family protein